MGESVVEEFVDAHYLKGEYIAVRTDGDNFYLAEVRLFITTRGQNYQKIQVLADVLVEDNKESFKIRWFDVSGEDNVYVRSFRDKIYLQSVVCPEVKLKKETRGRFRLEKPMLDKIKRRIRQALQADSLRSEEN